MGGPLPLGYEVENRRLVINPEEAKLVNLIMERYLVEPSVQALADYLNAKGYRTKIQIRASGPHKGGCAFRRGTLYHLLANPIYLGRIVHKGEVYPGEHEPIVSETLWQAVQDKLKANASGTSRRLKGQQPSLLTGLLQDSEGRAMTPSHASKGMGKGKGQAKTQRYRYYVTRPDQTKGQPAYRISAHDIERIVISRLAAYLAVPANIANLAGSDIDAHALQQALAKADLAAAALRSGSTQAKHQIITQMLAQAVLHEDRVELTLSNNGLADILSIALNPQSAPIILSVAANRLRHGRQIRLVIEGEGGLAKTPVKPSPPAVLPSDHQRDTKLIALLADAHAARKLVLAHPDTPLADLAKQQGKCRKHLAKLIEISCLAPDVVEAVVGSKQPSSLTAGKLRSTQLTLAWDQQRRMLLLRGDGL
jgi:hypothetical protein